MKYLKTFRFWVYCKLEAVRKILFKQTLQNFEKKVYSQNGEDGIIEEIFQRIGVGNRFFIEIGINYSGTKVQGNTPLLLEKKWEGVWIDCTPSFKERASLEFKQKPVTIETKLVTRGNIAQFFESLNIPKTFDLLSIDVDGNDYWIWESLSEYKPTVVVMEYNAAHGPFKRWIMPYNEKHVWNGSCHFGASLKSYSDLGKKLGYFLVGCDSQGVNAFFVKEELKNHFSGFRFAPAFFYSAGKYNAPQLGW